MLLLRASLQPMSRLAMATLLSDLTCFPAPLLFLLFLLLLLLLFLPSACSPSIHPSLPCLASHFPFLAAVQFCMRISAIISRQLNPNQNNQPTAAPLSCFDLVLCCAVEANQGNGWCWWCEHVYVLASNWNDGAGTMLCRQHVQ